MARVLPLGEILQAYPKMTKIFVKEWKDRTLVVDGKLLVVTKGLIADSTGLSTNGRRIFKDKKAIDKAMKLLINGKEISKLVKFSSRWILQNFY